MMKYLLKHIRECITIVAQIVIGILLLVNPSIYAVSCCSSNSVSVGSSELSSEEVKTSAVYLNCEGHSGLQ